MKIARAALNPARTRLEQNSVAEVSTRATRAKIEQAVLAEGEPSYQGQ